VSQNYLIRPNNRILIGFNTNHTITAAMRFISPAARNTACQSPVTSTTALDTGTATAATPLAV
jgi:hypothetical protein